MVGALVMMNLAIGAAIYSAVVGAPYIVAILFGVIAIGAALVAWSHAHD